MSLNSKNKTIIIFSVVIIVIIIILVIIYNKQNNNKSTTTSQVKPQQNSPDVKHQYIIDKDIDYPGNDISGAGGIVNNFDECIQKCKNTPGCNAITFNSKNNFCIPKTKKGDVHSYNGAFSTVINQ